MSVTIRDVARQAGVSVATVSKILNRKPGISEATTQRVEAVMKKLDYAPNSRAASLARRSARSVIYLTQLPEDIAYKNPHRFDILCGVQSALAEKGYSLFVMDAGAQPGETVSRIVMQKLADGVIFHGVPIDKGTAALLTRRRFPHLVIGHPGADTRLCWVEINQTVGGQIAAEHLLERGYRRIGVLCGSSSEELSYLRLRGFRIAMQDAGLPVNEDWILHTGCGLEGSFQGALDLLRRADRPSAVICSSNLHALGLYQAARSLGMRVPGDVAVITFDKYPYSALLDPPPSYVHLDVNDLGRTAGKMLLRELKDPELLVQSYTTLPQLAVGATTPFARSRAGHPEQKPPQGGQEDE